MNDTDRKLFAELLSAISDHLVIPEPREYNPKTDKQQAALAWDRASDVRIFTGMDAADIDPDHIRTTIKLLRERQAKLIPYEVETEEQARVCVCGSRSRFHDADGKIVKHYDWETHTCNGFTPATNEEEKAS